jgi:hypothetical protein
MSAGGPHHQAHDEQPDLYTEVALEFLADVGNDT